MTSEDRKACPVDLHEAIYYIENAQEMVSRVKSGTEPVTELAWVLSQLRLAHTHVYAAIETAEKEDES